MPPIKIANNTLQENNAGRNIRMNSGVDIDLASVEQNITLGNKLFAHNQSVTINVGGEEKTLQAGSQVTAGEYVAVKQVLLASGQKIMLDGSGRAVGGEVDMTAITSRGDRMKVDDLVLPVNLTAYADFGKRSTFQVSGDLLNQGSLFAYSSQHGVKSGTIRAENIVNAEGALLSAVVPDNVLAAVEPAVDLNLHAENTLSNFGTISSSGNLKIDAPHVVNAGLIKSVHNNVQFDAPGELNINNQGGVISAPDASIVIRDPSFNGNFNTTVTGGDLLSKKLEVNSGQGTADLKVGELTGEITQTGVASHVEASTANLSLGKICLTGDPTYKNSAGSITINGDITVGEALTIIASNHIFNTAPAVITAGNASKGFPITLIAGAEFLNGSGTDTTKLGPIPPAPVGTATTITGKGSTTGGGIYLGNSYGGEVTINARATIKKGNANGADVLMAAFRKLSVVSGQIDLTGSTINTGGKGTGNNGNVILIAGGIDGPSINGPMIETLRSGTINTTGGTGAGGDIELHCLTPRSTGGDVAYNANGTLASVDFIEPGSVVQNGAILNVNGNITGTNSIKMRSGASSLDSILLGPDVLVKTIGVNGKVTLIPSFGAQVQAEAGSLISTKNLEVLAGTGDVGTAAKPLITDAPYVNIDADNMNTQAFLRDTNKNIVVFEGILHDLTAVVDGTFVNKPGTSIGVITLNLTSLTGSIGLSKLSPLVTTADDMTFNAGGSVFVENHCPNSIQFIGANSAFGTFDVQGDKNYFSTANITASVVNLGTQGLFFTNFDPTITAATSATFSSTTAGFDDNRLPTAKIVTPLLVLNAATGDVGVDATTRYTLSAGIGGVKISAPNGGAFLQSQGNFKKGFNIAGASLNGVYLYTGNGPTNITGGITANSITVEAKVAKLAVSPNVVLSSNLLIALRATDASKGSIVLGKNSQIKTVAMGGFGSVFLQIGPTSTAVVGAPPSKGVSYAESGGTIFWGQAGIKAKSPTNMLFAKGADIVITNSLASKNVSLGGGVQIIADPPIEDESSVVWYTTGGNGHSASILVPGQSVNDSFSGAVGTTSAGSVATPDFDFNFTNLLASNTGNLLSAASVIDSSTPGRLEGTLFNGFDDDSYITASGGGNGSIDAALCGDGELKNCLGTTVRHMPMQDRVHLNNDRVVFAPEHDTVIDTTHGSIKLKAGAVVLVSDSKRGLAVYNLHDEKKSSVVVIAFGKQHSLIPGQHALVSGMNGRDFREVNAIESIGHRHIRSHSLNGTSTLYSSEFSIPSVLSTVHPFQQMLESNRGSAGKLLGRVIKTAAVLITLNKSEESYQRYGKPLMTALAPRN